MGRRTYALPIVEEQEQRHVITCIDVCSGLIDEIFDNLTQGNSNFVKMLVVQYALDNQMVSGLGNLRLVVRCKEEHFNTKLSALHALTECATVASFSFPFEVDIWWKAYDLSEDGLTFQNISDILNDSTLLRATALEQANSLCVQFNGPNSDRALADTTCRRAASREQCLVGSQCALLQSKIE